MADANNNQGTPINVAHSSIYATHPATFMQFPPYDPQAEGTEVVITGIPFDLACTGRSGTRMGPKSIRLASANLIWEGIRWPWEFALDDHLRVADAGDLHFSYGEPQTLVDNLEAHADRVLEAGRQMLSFGGDHFISLPLLRAHARRHGPLALIHFDAHTDTYSGGTQYDHGTIFHHAVQEGLVDTEHSIQIGIRTTYDRRNHPFEVLDAAWVNDQGPAAVLERIRQRVGSRKAYLSFDIDGLDPTHAPGTGTPVSGGLSIDCALKVVRGMTGLELVGMDLVEVNPAYDHAEITSLAAATLALEFLYVLAANKS
ncbi:Agmatinase [Marinobacterium nitratireducens]|uniref:Agmatinase n=1 Tax=Marinobacterium nitratireducens TaxID=518897 RepID=A0A918DVE7_9GAMM|nr:agmatinase [Marinobacterium nitratireducens]GGO83549.1 Agmatinase [Marinobacterium nitratireducens]